jgi:hypothetical protein
MVCDESFPDELGGPCGADICEGGVVTAVVFPMYSGRLKTHLIPDEPSYSHSLLWD